MIQHVVARLGSSESSCRAQDNTVGQRNITYLDRFKHQRITQWGRHIIIVGITLENEQKGIQFYIYVEFQLWRNAPHSCGKKK